MDERCGMCGSEVYLNPSMKLLASICSHKFCESCINKTFVTSVSVQCPICKTTLKKGNFLFNKFEVDPEFESEMRVRNSILQIYNKRRENFANLKQYNDYLESVEDIIYNLVNGIDVAETQEKIKKYKEENQELIVVNQSKKAEESRELQARLNLEEEEKEQRRQKSALEERKQLQEKLSERESILDDMAAGKPNAKRVGNTTTELKKPSRGTKGAPPVGMAPPPPLPGSGPAPPPSQPHWGASKMPYYAPAAQTQAALSSAPPTKPMPPPEYSMPQPIQAANSMEREVEKDIAKQKVAGGWKDEFISLRAISEAFNDIFC